MARASRRSCWRTEFVRLTMACMSRPATLLCLLLVSVGCAAQQQKKKIIEFPNKEEIQLVVTQSERVLEQYKQSVAMEAELPTAKREPSGVEKDRGVYDAAAKLIADLKIHPESFHGVGGLLLLSSLDDASRNAALCSGTAYGDTMEAVMSQSDINSAKDWIHIGLSCVEVSGYLCTVSESVHALLVREMEAQQLLNQRAMETMNKCTAAMKKCGSASAR
jgi:hypothetical protein